MSDRDASRKTQAEWFGEQAHAAWQTGQSALAAGDLVVARRWLERACRLAPRDATAKLSLAVVLLRLRDAGAAPLFAEIAAAHDVREAWLGLATAQAEAGAWDQAIVALGAALSRHVLAASADIDSLAGRIAHAAGVPGWCCLRADGRVEFRLSPAQPGKRAAWLDGVRLPAVPRTIPGSGARLMLTQNGAELLGSPLDLSRARDVEGFVAAQGGGIAGWAWLPGNPDTDPILLVRPARGGKAMRCVATDMGMVATSPMARPRRFAIAAAALAGQTGLLHVVGPDGRDLPGSPLDPHADSLAGATVAAAMAEAAPWISNGRARRRIDPRLLAVPADLVGPPARARRDPARRLAVVVPVYRDRALTLACIAAIRATAPPGTHVIVVDDATPEPELAAALDALAAEGAIRLLRHPRNRGFPAAANAGLRAAAKLAGRPDVVLLNSDALLTAGALAALRDLVHAAPDIGTATPLSNDATILSYPDRDGGAPAPEGPARARLARLAAQANAGRAVDIPTAVGFCMYVRRECLAAVGLFREDVFAQGYGEENDFCLRARHLGWRHVAAPGVFVSHVGGRSFGASRHALIARNLSVLERLHPGYHALIAAHQAADPLAPARRRLDMLRWRAGRARSGAASTIIVTHDSGGGVERVVRRRCEELRAAGMRAIVLRPVLDPAASSADAKRHLPGLVELCDGVEHGYPNLRFAIPGELDTLARLLRADRPVALEIHHLLGHDHAILQLASRLGLPHDIHLHDYAWFCPRITLLGAGGRYCGEPEDPATCEACIADLGRNDEQDIAVAALRARSANDLGGARSVIAPSADAASRLRRHFPSVRTRLAPLEDDSALPPATALRPAAGRRRVGVVGGIGPEKGYDILLACARDAARRGLDLEFVVIGHTVDDARLHATGRVFVTGPYREARAVEEIRAQAVDLAFLPSIWPETWCYTLGHAWAAGLRVVAFDIGAPAARIRATGRGWVLPLGLPAAAINNALLAAQTVAGDECRVAGSA